MRLVGPNIGHGQEKAGSLIVENQVQLIEGKKDEWCARRDSNSRPNAPEATFANKLSAFLVSATCGCLPALKKVMASVQLLSSLFSLFLTGLTYQGAYRSTTRRFSLTCS